MNTMEDFFGDAIYSYTRKQAIKDGTLIDLSQFPITSKYWKVHVASTSTVWDIIKTANESTQQPIDAILDAIYQQAYITMACRTDIPFILFSAIINEQSEDLKLHIGGGDEGELVLTLMLPLED